MSFLAPMFLVGGLAVGLPILFHLIRRTSKDKIPFSSLMFLMPTPPRVTRRSRLENIWLLILRCLVILLLAAGFARPFIQKPLSANPNSGNGARIVVLLDTSASMKREGLWQDARAEAESLVKRAAPGDQISLVAFDREIHTLWSFDDWSRMSPPERLSRARQQLQSLNPGWNATHLGNALVQASEMLQDSRDKQVENRKIIVISDLQKGSQLEGLQGHEWPKGVEVSLQPVKNRRDNAGLQLVSEREESGDGELKIRVSNANDSSHEQFRIGWRKNNATAGDTVVAYVPPGQSRIFTAPRAATNLALEQLVLTGDQEEFDNTAFWVLPKPE
ncbi:MAG TPA: BatA domain-containing protein, partial [Candidatus Saccharimonadales bacterium]|nr:BatA domain-containing protein [Candidatus Saccharimonadales bacterium]